MGKLTIKTNNVPRDILDYFDLPKKWQREFKNYPDCEDESFFMYRNWCYPLGDFMRIDNKPPKEFEGWHGYSSDTYFSGILIKLVDNGERVVTATYYS